jgi:hypothetical protein
MHHSRLISFPQPMIPVFYPQGSFFKSPEYICDKIPRQESPSSPLIILPSIRDARVEIQIHRVLDVSHQNSMNECFPEVIQESELYPVSPQGNHSNLSINPDTVNRANNRRIGGLQPWVFWSIIVMIGFAIVGASVGGAVGGTRHSSSSNSNDNSSNNNSSNNSSSSNSNSNSNNNSQSSTASRLVSLLR